MKQIIIICAIMAVAVACGGSEERPQPPASQADEDRVASAPTIRPTDTPAPPTLTDTPPPPPTATPIPPTATPIPPTPIVPAPVAEEPSTSKAKCSEQELLEAISTMTLPACDYSDYLD